MSKKILLVCTSTAANVRRAIDRFPQDEVFLDHQLDLLCTSGDLPDYQSWPNVRRRLLFPKRRDYWAAFRFWWSIFQQEYAVVVVLWCLDPGRKLSKLFALLCNGRRVLVFNENLDCAFLSLGWLRSFLSARAQAGAFDGSTIGKALVIPIKHGAKGIAPVLLFPVRLLILLICVAALRLGGQSK